MAAHDAVDDSLSINDADDLYAKLPLGAASLEGELKRTGKLLVKTVVAGQLRLEGAGVGDVPADGACAQATHLVTALSVGAFSLTAGGERQGNLGASLTMGEAKVERELSAEQLRSAGDFDACGQSTVESPNGNCASPIQVFLTPLPGRAAEEGPPGTVKVDFLSANPARPLGRVLRRSGHLHDALRPLRAPRAPRDAARARRGFGDVRRRQGSRSPNLLEQDAPHLQLEAHPTARGQWVTGMTFMSLTGMAVVTGLVAHAARLLARGGTACARRGSSRWAWAPSTFAGSLWLFLDARPRAEVAPYTEGGALLALPSKPGVHVAPGGLWGTF